MNTLAPVVARIPTWGIAAGTAVLAALAVIGVVVSAELVADVAFGAAGVAALGGGVALGWARHRLLQLPLVISPRGLRDGAVARFRARLGYGRVLRRARARVTLRLDGVERPLDLVLSELPLLVGPWTLVARLPDDLPDSAELHVEVSGREAGRARVAARTWRAAELEPGVFAPPGRVAQGRFHLDTAGWDQVAPPDTPTG